jgi:hypothetical protein
MIIGINGYAGSGKDTVGTIIQYMYANHSHPSTSLEEVLKNPDEHDWWLEEQSEWEIKKWAGKLKEIASMLTGIPKHKFEDQEFKKTNLSSEWDCNPPGKVGTIYKQPLTVREFLQRLGTDALRYGLHENAWVNALMSDYKKIDYNDDEQPEYPNWIITDTRFPNEAQAIKNMGGVVIRIDRPGVIPINDHPSEIGLDSWNFDYKIANVSDIKALSLSVKMILEKENIL